MQEAGCRRRDAGCGMQEVGCRRWDAGGGMQEAGCRRLDAGGGMQEVGCGMRVRVQARSLARLWLILERVVRACEAVQHGGIVWILELSLDDVAGWINLHN